MKTAALLPTPGDPLLARYWVNNYRQTWQGETDELVVLINGHELDSIDVYESVGARVEFTSERLGHGQAMRRLLAMTDADIVMYAEDDAFVRREGVVTKAFDLIRAHETDVIGCPRGGMDPAIGEAAVEKWGECHGPDGSSGYGLWPAFLFARTADLRATSQRFESWTWVTGETVPGVNYTVPHPMTTDTMSTVAFELHDRHDVTLTVNHKELDQKDLGRYPFDPPWFHAGGLSNDPTLARGGDSNEGRDWAHRFWWWRRIGHDYRHLWNDVDPDYWTDILEPWITWDE